LQVAARGGDVFLQEVFGAAGHALITQAGDDPIQNRTGGAKASITGVGVG
jgi:hypothetical protein